MVSFIPSPCRALHRCIESIVTDLMHLIEHVRDCVKGVFDQVANAITTFCGLFGRGSLWREEEASQRISTIAIRTLTGETFQTQFDPNELVWQFSLRTRDLMISTSGLGVQDSGTSPYALLHKRRYVNTFSNRLRPIGEIITDPSLGLYAIAWELSCSGSSIFFGNCSPNGGVRDVCTICLDKIIERGGDFDGNPQVITTLKCSHAFHRECIQSLTACPLCRAPIL